MTVTAVCTFDVVFPLKAGAHAGRDRFLADIDMHIAQNLTGLARTLGLKIELADLHHCFVMSEQFFFGKHFILLAKNGINPLSSGGQSPPAAQLFSLTVLS